MVKLIVSEDEARTYHLIAYDVTAMQITEENAVVVAGWCGGYVVRNSETNRFIKLSVPSPRAANGFYTADLWYYVGKMMDGTFFVMDPELFEQTYALITS